MLSSGEVGQGVHETSILFLQPCEPKIILKVKKIRSYRVSSEVQEISIIENGNKTDNF